jgi:hypothetical protein
MPKIERELTVAGIVEKPKSKALLINDANQHIELPKARILFDISDNVITEKPKVAGYKCPHCQYIAINQQFQDIHIRTSHSKEELQSLEAVLEAEADIDTTPVPIKAVDVDIPKLISIESDIRDLNEYAENTFKQLKIRNPRHKSLKQMKLVNNRGFLIYFYTNIHTYNALYKRINKLKHQWQIRGKSYSWDIGNYYEIRLIENTKI